MPNPNPGVKMKLSKAIIEGSKTGPQCFNGLSYGSATCVLGAALRANGCSTATYYPLIDLYPWAFVGRDSDEPGPKCHLCKSECLDLSGVMVHLNDSHNWSRECIAEWVSTIEPADEPANAAVTREREAEAVGTSDRG